MLWNRIGRFHQVPNTVRNCENELHKLAYELKAYNVLGMTLLMQNE
jgi:hypothetical protein